MRFLLALKLSGLAIPLFLWWSSVGNPADYFQAGVPDGQALYIFSKLAGLVALYCLSWQLVLVLARAVSVGHPVLWTAKAHRALGVLIVLLVALHAGLFVAAASVRSGHLALGPLSVRFTQGFYDQMLSVGAIALYLLLVLAGLGAYMAKTHRAGRFKQSHRQMAFAVSVLAMVHSYAIGSETSNLLVFVLYSAISIVLIWALLRRSHTQPHPTRENH